MLESDPELDRRHDWLINPHTASARNEFVKQAAQALVDLISKARLSQDADVRQAATVYERNLAGFIALGGDPKKVAIFGQVVKS